MFISPGLVVPFGSYWRPYTDPPVVIVPSPRVDIEPPPPPPHYWYYCDPRKPTTRMSNSAPEGGVRSCRHPHDRRR